MLQPHRIWVQPSEWAFVILIANAIFPSTEDRPTQISTRSYEHICFLKTILRSSSYKERPALPDIKLYYKSTETKTVMIW